VQGALARDREPRAAEDREKRGRAADRGADRVGRQEMAEQDAECSKRGAATFEAMSPPDTGSMRRTSVTAYEVVLDRKA